MKRFQLISLSFFSAILLSLPWLNILPGWILFIAFLPLLIVEDQLMQKKQTNRPILFFGYAYLTFCLWNIFSSYWLVFATTFGAILILVLNACLMATVWWLYHLFRRSHKRLANLALVSCWLAFEFVHFHWDVEWPWLTLGNGFANQVSLVQWYEYTGVLGGSLWVLVCNILLFKIYKYVTDITGAFQWSRLLSLFFVIFIPIVFSNFLFFSYNKKGKAINVVVLQPNIDPYLEKFGTMTASDQLDRLIELADSLVDDSTNYLVAPETAIHPVWINEQLSSHPYILPFKNLIHRYPQLQVVVGATTKKRFYSNQNLPLSVRKEKDHASYYDVYNSALQIDQSSRIQFYHKSILVCGVEKMPFTNYFPFIEDLIVDMGGTTGRLGSQSEPSVLAGRDSIQVAPVICYESAFGGYLTKYIQKGAELIFVITNDGWWKNTHGYRQHLSFSRLRAIETRRSIARSANTGVSALIDQRGIIIKQTKWWVKTALKGGIYSNDKLTFYVKYGDFIGRISAFIAVLLLLFLLKGRFLKK